MYKNREIKIEKSDDLDKIARKTNLINKKVINVNESFCSQWMRISLIQKSFKYTF